MAFILCCFDDGPIEGDRFAAGTAFATPLSNACCTDPGCCLAGFFCPCCTLFKLRYDYLRGDMSQFLCCQGLWGGCLCLRPGRMGEKSCPELCLACEVILCPGLSISATRMSMMQSYQLQSDPFDRKLIRFSNCLQMLSCLCTTVAICVPECQNCARMTEKIADLVFWSVLGCMSAQVHHEMAVRNHQTSQAPLAPHGAGGGIAPPRQQNMHRGHPNKPTIPQPVSQAAYQAQPAATQTTMQVICPQGAGPGTMIQIQDAQGQLVQVQVPQGVYPGTAFMIQTQPQVAMAVAQATPVGVYH